MIWDEPSATIIGLLGVPFLAYVLNLSPEVVAARVYAEFDRLPDPAEEALSDLLRHAINLASDTPTGFPESVIDEPMSARMRRFGWIDEDRRHSHANLFRLAVGGELPVAPRGHDPAVGVLAAMAADYYPLTLLPQPAEYPFPLKPRIARARVSELDEALRGDPLATLLHPDAFFFTSTGMGYGGPTAGRIAECALVTAEQRLRVLGPAQPQAYVDEVLKNLATMRELVSAEHAEVPVVIGIWNVEIAENTELRGPRGGRIRAARDTDPHVPMAARATAVLETTCGVGFSLGTTPPSRGTFFDGVSQLHAEEKLVSLAGLLATSRTDQRAMPVVAWTKTFDPFQPYVGSYTADPGGVPTVVFPAERLGDFEDWLLRLEAHYDPSIRVAVFRCVSAFAERSTWDDSLIDLVIALENLFGGPGTKLSDQIGASLATLLGNSAADKADIKKRAQIVYKVRSELVHGDEVSERDTHPREDAARLLLDALEALFTTRAELISDRKSRRRLARVR